MDIEQRYLDRLKGMRQTLLLGMPFDDALEMLPAEPRPCRSEAGSAPQNEGEGSRELTGTLLCNNTFFEGLRFDGGFDGGCVVNYFGKWQDVNFLKDLDSWRDLAKEYEERGDAFIHEYYGVKFEVMPYGSNRGVNFKYVLKWQGFTILIRGGKYKEDLPAVQVDFSYEVFREKDIFDARFLVEDLLLHFGFKWEKVTFQRIDLNVTLNESFQKVAKAFQQGRFLSRVRRFNAWSSNSKQKQVLNYIAGGTHKSEVQVVLYDKLYELTSHYNEQKFVDLKPVLGEGTDLTRVEFRLTSAFFRTIDCFSYEKLSELMPSIVNYLVTSWFRVLKTKKIRGKENKQELDEFWLKVQYAFQQVFIKKEVVKRLKREKTSKISNMRLLRQAVGCVSSALARSYEKTKDLETFCAEIFDVFLRYKRLSYYAYRKKRAVYETRICQT